MNRPSSAAIVQRSRFFFLDHRKRRSGWALARIQPNGEAQMAFSADFRPENEESAAHWLGYRVHGVMMTSEFEWEELTRGLADEWQGRDGIALDELVQSVGGYFDARVRESIKGDSNVD